MQLLTTLSHVTYKLPIYSMAIFFACTKFYHLSFIIMDNIKNGGQEMRGNVTMEKLKN